MTRAELLRAAFKDAHEALEGTMAEVTQELASAPAPGTANGIGERYGHHATTEDNLVQGVLQGRPPLMSSTWQDRTGISEPRFGTDPEHSRRVRADLTALRAYAQAVYAATDTYVASLSDADLDRTVDMTAVGFGSVPVWWVLTRLVLGHIYEVGGEIAAVKGALGVKGLPF